MTKPIDHILMDAHKVPAANLFDAPEALRLAYGPTEPFPNDLGQLVIDESFVPMPYCGDRRIATGARGSCKIFAVLRDPETARLRIFGSDSQTEFFNLNLKLIDTSVVQVREQVCTPFRRSDGSHAHHYIDLLVTKADGRKIAEAVKPRSRVTPDFMQELEQLRRTMPDGIADEVHLVTEECWKRSEAVNAVLYNRLSLWPDPLADARLRDVLSDMSRVVTLAELAELCRAGGRGFQAGVRAIYEGGLECLSPGRINLFTQVRRAQ